MIIKKDRKIFRKLARIAGFGLSFAGFGMILFFTFPLMSWKLFNEPAFANQDMETPIPKVTVLSKESLRSLVSASANSLSGVDLTDASNWYPQLDEKAHEEKVSSYSLSIKKLKIFDAEVSTVDNNLKEHLVNFGGTAVPPERGTAVVFGHSTLPQLFNPKDYKTIFAKAHLLKNDDLVEVTVNGATYTYRIYNIFITTPDDMSVLTQEYDDSYLTIITCTPPGTIWKRLIIQAKLESI
jgi:sortase A